MWIYNQASSKSRTALIYITAGALLVIWTLVWYVYLHNNPPETKSVHYLCGGFLMTGLALMVIGFGLGQMGRAARPTATPVEVVTPVVVTSPLSAPPTPIGAADGTLAQALPPDGRRGVAPAQKILTQ